MATLDMTNTTPVWSYFKDAKNSALQLVNISDNKLSTSKDKGVVLG